MTNSVLIVQPHLHLIIGATVRKILLFGIILVVLGQGCSKRITDNPIANKPPETFLSLHPDDTLRATSSRQHLKWWGVDADGFVVGFKFSFDGVNWSYTTQNDSIFSLKITGTDTTYRFYIVAVDDKGAVDPTAASLDYPITNTAPTVSFVMKSDVPETTFTVATFQWDGYDLDGNETIAGYFYSIDDTTNPSQWKCLPGTTNLVTLFKNDGLTEGNHVFYLYARDTAGAVSPVIRMPAQGKTWYVREPKGDFLIVDDYTPSDFAASFYKTIFDSLINGKLGSRDVLDIKKGASNVKRGDFVPALINPTFVETLKLFKYVFWYADNSPSMTIAQTGLSEYKKWGGKVLFVTAFQETVTGQGGMGDFAPISDVEPSFFSQILLGGDSLVTVADSTYPSLVRDRQPAIYQFPRGVIAKSGTVTLYKMGPSTRWTGDHFMGVKEASPTRVVLLAVMLHRFGDGQNNTKVKQLLTKVFRDEFGVQ
jgi:hypothetical protein